MSDYISIVKNNPTVGTTDGTVVSEDELQTSPISFALNATEEEIGVQKLAIRCKSKYKTVDASTTKLSFEKYDATTKKYTACTDAQQIHYWLAPDENFADATAAKASTKWAHSLNITDCITDTNMIFWVKCDSSKTETPSNDTSISLTVNANIIAQ